MAIPEPRTEKRQILNVEDERNARLLERIGIAGIKTTL